MVNLHKDNGITVGTRVEWTQAFAWGLPRTFGTVTEVLTRGQVVVLWEDGADSIERVPGYRSDDLSEIVAVPPAVSLTKGLRSVLFTGETDDDGYCGVKISETADSGTAVTLLDPFGQETPVPTAMPYKTSCKAAREYLATIKGAHPVYHVTRWTGVPRKVVGGPVNDGFRTLYPFD